MLPPRAVLRLALLAWLGLAAPAGAGCDQPNDQPILHQEVLTTAKAYDRRLDELARRADELDRRRRALPHDTLDSAPAEHDLAQARSAIEDLRGYLQGVRARLAGTPGSAPELRRLLDELRARLDDGVIEASAELAAVDSWIANAAPPERAGAQPPPGPEPANPAPPAPPAPSEPEDRASGTDRSGAPIR